MKQGMYREQENSHFQWLERYTWQPLISFLSLWICLLSVQFSSIARRVRLIATPKNAAHQASLSITDSRSLLKLMSIQSVMLSNHLILCHPLFLPPSIFPSIRVFSNGSVLHISQFSCSVVSDFLPPHEPQHARPPCPSPTPRVHPNPCSLSQ